MAKLTFVQPDTVRMTIDAQNDISVMHAALSAGVSGIVAECGGNLACATCHVYVEEGYSVIPQPSEGEIAMLDFTASVRRPESRLSCQINVTDTLEGCVFVVAPEQL
jgi:2Fe-2S ferredoxin